MIQLCQDASVVQLSGYECEIGGVRFSNFSSQNGVKFQYVNGHVIITSDGINEKLQCSSCGYTSQVSHQNLTYRVSPLSSIIRSINIHPTPLLPTVTNDAFSWVDSELSLYFTNKILGTKNNVSVFGYPTIQYSYYDSGGIFNIPYGEFRLASDLYSTAAITGSNASADLVGSWDVDIETDKPVSVTPEPSTYILMLTGLALVFGIKKLV